MAAQDYTSVVQQLYVSYFGRPADYYGLQNFSEQLDAMGAPKTFDALQAAVQADTANSALSQLVNSFNASPESVALYGSDNTQIGIGKFVNAIYQNVLGRDADKTGYDFWVSAITSGTLTKANAAASITQAALTNTSDQGKLDALTVQNKLSVATSFTTALDTPVEITSFSGDAAAAAARSLLAGVNSGTNLTAYQDTITQTIENLGAVVNGQTFTVGAGVDTLVGTSGNDVFNALSVNASGENHSTLGSFDSIDGGAGKDTLNIYATTAENTLADVSNLTIKNVETVNVYSTDPAGTAALADASHYTGVTALWQIGNAADVTNLQSGTTAGFRGLTTVGVHGVQASDAATSATVALDGVVEGSTFNIGSAVGAGKLAGVTLSGTVVDGTDSGSSVGNTNLNVTVGKDVQSLTVNTAVATVLTVADNGKAVNTIDASASTGKITFVGDTDVTTISTGTGADSVTLASALGATVKAASVNTGAGNDTIIVTATGTDVTVDSATVNGGDGNDNITVTLDNNVKYNVTGGAGNDTITLVATGDAAVKTGDVIDGGDGTDTIGLAGKDAYVADDYLVYTKVLKNFEAIEFNTIAGATTAFDASQVAGFKAFTFDAGGAITKVAADQVVTTAGDLTIQAAGYTSDVPAGALKVAVTATAAIAAKAASIDLTVTGKSGGADGHADATLTGDVKTASITLTNGVNSDKSAAVAAVHLGSTDLGHLASLTLAGNGTAMVDNGADTKLVTVDASALASVDGSGHAAAGLMYTSANASAETIKLGAGIDTITLSATAYGGVGSAHTFDTVSGLNLVLNDAKDGLAAGSDVLTIGTGGLSAAKFTTTETDLDLALKAAAAANNADTAHDTLVFTFGGDTYVMMDNGSSVGLIDATDTVVKLTGTVNLDALVIDLAHAPV
jgi:trimeric autotransporter adhesin